MIEVLGVFGVSTINGGAGTDTLSFANADKFTQEDGLVRSRNGEGVGVDVNLSSNTAWTWRTWQDAMTRQTLSSVENVTGTQQADTLTGDAKANVLDGQTGNDTLTGGLGLDTLTGGSGSDRFVMSASLAASNADSVTDFSVAQGDTLALDDAVFTLLTGKTNLSNHFRLSTRAAVGGDDYLVYNPSTGALSYDASGNGTGTAQLFATLANKPQDLTAAQFAVI